jgi:trehalose 6-phosphate phosphatase
MVFEIKPKGKDKGTAIAEFIEEKPFLHRKPVFIGDDITDEDGFMVINQIGGYSIKVGEGPTLARWRLDDSHAVQYWLASYLSFLQTQGTQ